MPAHKNLGPLLKVTLTVVLLVLVFRSVDVSLLKSHLSRIDLGQVVLLLFVHWGTQLISAQRWRLFAAALGVSGSYGRFVVVQFAGMFLNLGLPSLVGGDVVKAYAVTRRAEVPFRFGLASVLQDRGMGLIALLAYGSAAVLLLPLKWGGIPLIAIYGLVWLACGALFLVVWKGELIYRRLRTGESTRLQGIVRRLAGFHETLALMRLGASAGFQVVLLSLANSALVIFIVLRMCDAAHHPVSVLAVSALVPLIDVLSMLPISFAGLGIREWGYVQALPLVGVPPDAALAIALSLSALLVVRSLIGAFFLPWIGKTGTGYAVPGAPK